MSVTYDYFLADARRAAVRFAELAPQIPATAIRRGYAESVRIASRKALAAGNVRSRDDCSSMPFASIRCCRCPICAPLR